jgi:hypothetical protein
MRNERGFTIPAVWLVDESGKKDASFANRSQENTQPLSLMRTGARLFFRLAKKQKGIAEKKRLARGGRVCCDAFIPCT